MFKITEIKTLPKPDYPKGNPLMENPENLERSNRSESRYESVMKVLKPDTAYTFVSTDTPSEFFNNPRLPYINISVIVGENGMGKSTLVDLMIRIINNTAYALRFGLEKHEEYHLRFVRDIYAELHFETTNGKYSITQEDTKLTFREENSIVWSYDFSDRHSGTYRFTIAGKKRRSIPKETIARLSKKWLSLLFYTIEVNYSAYSSNTLDLLAEYTCDEELEDDERADMGKVDENTRIWMHNIFHKNDSYQLPLVLTPFRTQGKINYNNEQDLSRDRLCRLAMMETSPLDEVLEGKKPKSIRFNVNSHFSCRIILPHNGTNIISFGLMKECQSLRTVFDIELTQYHQTIFDFSYDILSIWKDLLKIDLEEEAKKLNGLAAGDGDRALSYLVYKTIKIAGRYNKFSKWSDPIKELFKSYEPDPQGSMVNHTDIKVEEIKKYLRELLADETHVTLKLRRTLALLIFRHYTTKEKEISLPEFDKVIKKNVAQQDIILSKVRMKYVAKNEEDVHHPHKWGYEELLPCPAVRADILFELTEGGKIRTTSLSSGERQLLSVLSAAVYHVYNLHTQFDEHSREKRMIPYPYVNIIFDEAELYFHPKYQTQVINALLAALAGLRLHDTIQGINLIFVTHSPFLLSDIPRGNVLCLQDGLPSNGLDRTFCANVYDLLHNNFFMTRFIGEFAYKKLGEIISTLNSGDLPIYGTETVKKEIELIGDDFIRNSLMLKYEDKVNNLR